MSEVQVSIANLGTRNVVKQIKTAVTPSAVTAGVTTIVAVVFDRPFQAIPLILGINTPDEAAETCKAYVKAVTKVGMDVVLYNTVTTVEAAYDVDVTIQGQQAFS